MENETNVPAQLGLAFCINILKGMGLDMTTKEIKMPNVRITIQINRVYGSSVSNLGTRYLIGEVKYLA